MRQTYLEINLSNFEHNINEIKKLHPNKEIIPVIKANAYGTHINKHLDTINKFNIVAVAIVEEGVYLRKLGYKNDILVLNQPYKEDLPNIIKYDISIGLSYLDYIKDIKDKIKIHIEIESGMNRTGFKIEDLNELLSNLNDNIIIDGVYTHFSSAENDPTYTQKQINYFEKCVALVKEYQSDIKYIHSSASNGLLNYNLDFTNAIRPGIIMYGYYSSNEIKDKINIKPVAKLISKISYLKEIDKNESISYNRTYITDKKTKVATIGIGYADGYPRSLSNVGKVIINNKLCNIIGRVCMDSILVDVTELTNVKIGDTVYLFDNNLITLEDIAAFDNTINYEVLSTISERVPRKYIQE